MPKEIERKFLVDKPLWEALAKPEGIPVRQGYLSTSPQCNIRVRVYGDKGFITIKGKASGISREEFEYEIPKADAEEILRTFTPPQTAKVRYLIPYRSHTWEVDVFIEENEGLIVAEIELGSEEESFVRPDWTGREVTEDPRYLNSNLAKNPIRSGHPPSA
jgi:adenylate cyclase